MRFADRLTLVRTRYDCLGAALAESVCRSGISRQNPCSISASHPHARPRRARELAYATDAPLDMRMDPTTPLTAADIVNTYDEAALADILRRYGESGLLGASLPVSSATRKTSPIPLDRRTGCPCSAGDSSLTRRVGELNKQTFRRCASRSTMSWNRCARPFHHGCPRGGASRCWPTSR